MSKKKGGGTEYSDDEKEKVLELIADGSNLSQIEKIDGMPSRMTVCRWNRDDDAWCYRYRAALADRAHKMRDRARDANEILLGRAMKGEANSVFVSAVKQYSEYTKWECEVSDPQQYAKQAVPDVKGAKGKITIVCDDRDVVAAISPTHEKK